MYTKKQSKKWSQHISLGQRSPGNHDPKWKFKVSTRIPHCISICIHNLHNTLPQHGRVHNSTSIPCHNFHNKPNIPHLGNNGHPLTLSSLSMVLAMVKPPFSTPATNLACTNTDTSATTIGLEHPCHYVATLPSSPDLD